MVVAVPYRVDYYGHFSRVLEKQGYLRLYAAGTRYGVRGIPASKTKLLPVVGLLAYAAARTFGTYYGEAARFSLYPVFDRWAKTKLFPGDSVYSSYGYTNECFAWAQKNGGKTFLDGGNSHPANFWEILTEEHARWKCTYSPIAEFQHKRALAMMEFVDYVFAPSEFVAASFLSRGFKESQILRMRYPVDLTQFVPRTTPRPINQPLRVICTGGLSLRKGTPYLLEAFRIVIRSEPKARLLLTNAIAESVKPILNRYRDLPIDWSPALPHKQLAERLRSADIFVLPSLEEGLARTSLEAMACGLPVVVTSHTGSNDLVVEEISGSIVPIRDPAAIAEKILYWWQRIQKGLDTSRPSIDTLVLTVGNYDKVIGGYLRDLNVGTI